MPAYAPALLLLKPPFLGLVSVMRSRAHRGKTMGEWRKEQLAWLLDPVRPAMKG